MLRRVQPQRRSRIPPHPPPSPTLSATATATATAIATATGTPTPSRTGPVPPTPLGYTPDDPQGIGSWITAKTPANLAPEQQVVLQIWTRYWKFAMQAYNTRGMNLSSPEAMKSLDGVSTGQARANVLKGVSRRMDRGIMTVGESSYILDSIEVAGERAILRGCATDKSYEVNEQDKTVYPAPGSRPITDVVVRSGTAWIVQDTPFLKGKC